MASALIFESLKQDHDNHRALLDKIDAASNAAEREGLFREFRTEVTAHAAAEEESLYATMLAKPDLREDAQHSVSEHKEIDDYLEALGAQEVDSPEWLETYASMKTRYLHHIDEEEEEMFVNAAESLSAEEEQQLGVVFAERKPAEFAKAEDAIAGE